MDKNVPSKICRNKYTLPWVNLSLRRKLKKKARIYRHAKRSGKWEKYRHFQKECKREFRRAEWDHVNGIIQEGLDNKNSKPFWRYTKSKRQDNIGVAPLKEKGNLITDSVKSKYFSETISVSVYSVQRFNLT